MGRILAGYRWEKRVRMRPAMKRPRSLARNELSCMEKSSNVQKIAFLADYVPRRCGIATFTADLREAIATQCERLESFIVALTDRSEGYDYPSEVRFEISEQDISAYRRADFLIFPT